MNKSLLNAIIIYLTGSAFMYALLWVLQRTVFKEVVYVNAHNSFFFHLVVTSVILVQLYLFNKKFYDQLGFIFLGMITLKLVLVAIYMSPYLLDKVVYTKDELALFGIPYFFFLTFEVYFTKLLLDKKIS